MRFVLPLLLLLAFPGAASAATVISTGNVISYQGDLGETSDATVSLSADGQQIDFVEHSTNLAAGNGCGEVTTGEVACPVSGATLIAIDLGDNDDRLAIGLAGVVAPPVDVTGGDGVDLVSYTGTTGVTIALDGMPNDGPPGRGDNIHADVENASGTAVADAFTGTAGPNLLTGGTGRDTFTCGGGRDIVDGDKSDQVSADCEIVARNSRVLLGNGADKFKPFRPGLTVFGRRGNDTLTGGPGADTFSGGRGNDTIKVRGGKRDTVSCGGGRDKVTADRKDKVSKDCEKVTRK